MLRAFRHLPVALMAILANVAGAVPDASEDERSYLSCVRKHESRGEYDVVSRDKRYYGAYQFTRRTWNRAARYAGRKDLVGVAPHKASPADQDAMALVLVRWQGRSPWRQDGCR